jgi:hypothetical protein
MTLGLENATFRLVVQCLNQLRYRVPLILGLLVMLPAFRVRTGYFHLYHNTLF